MYQKLLTAEIKHKLDRAPLYSTDGQNTAPVLVKFFTPWINWTWYVLEAEKLEGKEYRFFGLVEGHENELGYFLLSELESLRGPWGLKIERDMHFDGYIVDKENRKAQRPNATEKAKSAPSSFAQECTDWLAAGGFNQQKAVN